MARTKKIDKEIWYSEVEKYKNACIELGRQITTSDLKHHFMGLKCWSWYPGNAPDELNIVKFSDFIKYADVFNVGNNRTYIERPSKEYVMGFISKLHDKFGRNVKASDLDNQEVSIYDILFYFGTINNMNKELGYGVSGTYTGHSYTQEELIQLLKDFYETTGIIPTQQFINKHNKEYGLPSRKTFTNKLGNWNSILDKCGIEIDKINKNLLKTQSGKLILQHDNKDFLIDLINAYVNEFDEVPTMRKMNKYYGTELKEYFKKYFGSWNGCLSELGYKLNSVSQYTDDELDRYFIDFVNEYNRVPTIQDFNKTDRPSFWVYQNRFGSWAEACIHYGYSPNCRKPEYYMEDGERCDSRYEYDISTWLKSNDINYERDVKYIDFTSNYKGKMNCDYVFTLKDGQKWYVEMAGFIKTFNFNKLTSREEQIYYFKIKYKIKLFNENNLNYIIIKPKDLEEKSLDDIFFFLDCKKTA